MTVYRDVMPAIVRVIAADTMDSTARQSWQKLIERKVDGGFRALLGARDQFDFDCILHALLHRELTSAEWDVLYAKYSTHDQRRLEAINRLIPKISAPCPHLFLTKAVYTWAIPKLKGKDGKRSTHVLRLPDEFYDINTWDMDARPDSTRSRWRRGVWRSLDALEEQAVVRVTEILEREQLI